VKLRAEDRTRTNGRLGRDGELCSIGHVGGKLNTKAARQEGKTNDLPLFL
jgi:hypothetical protein